MKKQQPLASASARSDHWSEHLNTCTNVVKGQGYSLGSTQSQVLLIKMFLAWLPSHAEISLDEIGIQRFLRSPHNARLIRRGGTTALYRFLRMLREQALVPPKREQTPSAQQRLIKNYERYLLEERGLTQATAVNNVGFANRFLSALPVRLRTPRLIFSQLRAGHVTDFVRRQSPKLSPGRAQLLVTALRSFLRFLLHQGKIRTHLALCVPTVARWSFSTLPKFLPAGSVERVIARNNRQSPIGRRDYAILLLLARLGLRACEVVALNLDDIDWKNARITIRAKGGRCNQLPLPADVGKALALYLRHGRPHCGCRRVFLRNRAPLTGFSGSQAISTLVSNALNRAGVESARKGAHLFRHSLATSMIRHGASLDEIGDLLCHRNPNTTAIYAKVDLPALRPLALPWPGGAR
jgi:site-specific recombinase XerD